MERIEFVGPDYWGQRIAAYQRRKKAIDNNRQGNRKRRIIHTTKTLSEEKKHHQISNDVTSPPRIYRRTALQIGCLIDSATESGFSAEDAIDALEQALEAIGRPGRSIRRRRAFLNSRIFADRISKSACIR
jgi:hypothetical protein